MKLTYAVAQSPEVADSNHRLASVLQKNDFVLAENRVNLLWLEQDSEVKADFVFGNHS
jgi:hypothetical protein